MNVIWIVSDTFRKDNLGCYGNEKIFTPSLDAFAKKSICMERHYAAGFPTMPTRADYFTGRLTGCFMPWAPLPRHLPENQQPLATVLSQAGFHTAAVVDTPFYTRSGFNYDRGFRSFIEIQGQEYWRRGLGDDTRKAWRYEEDRFTPVTFKRAANWLEDHYKENFFLYIDLWDPHEPWDAPNYYTELYWPDYDGEKITPLYSYWKDVEGFTEEKVKKAYACYCGEVTMVDTWFGYFMRQVENMGLLENTAVIFTTDHGFYFGEHGGLFGKLTRAKPSIIPYYFVRDNLWTYSPLYEELISIPLMIYIPQVAPGTYNGLNSAIDLMPTVLDIMNVNIPVQVKGKSLLPMLKDTSKKGRDYVISTIPFRNPSENVRLVDGQTRISETGSDTTITTEEWSLLYHPDPGRSFLYHLPSDPKQEKNVISEQPEVARKLHQYLVEFMKENNVAKELLNPRLELRI